ncbi:hypothetical protein [uncultured Bacteroides sp.]|uniref:hypothetical protein n=1 Tax=uncultured Bacteroides sp. TaxID=162156 RepID=UPI002AABC067|nr:hypothetical protein [uncultured Bacteroides sp.]
MKQKINDIDLKYAIGQQTVDQFETVNNADTFTRVVENWLKGIYIINPIAMLWDSCKQVE